MDSKPVNDGKRLAMERERDVHARRDAAKRNAAKGAGRNLEEAIRLVNAADEFSKAFRARP